MHSNNRLSEFTRCRSTVLPPINATFSYLAETTVLLLLVTIPGHAQQNRILGKIDVARVVRLKGNLSPDAQPRFDEGRVDSSFDLNLITLMLKPSPSQQTALDQLLDQQQDPESPNYHRWLTPEDYADRFGVSPSDLGKLVAWLQSEGFSIDNTARGRNRIVFHGTAGQIQNAFHTEIHYYRIDSEMYYANATEPSVPIAIEPLVMGILGLDGFNLKPGARLKRVAPDFTSSNGAHYLAPDDFATIYDVSPLYSAGFDGRGQTIAVVGQSDINLSDIRAFRSAFNLPASDPQLVLYGSDPGQTDEMEEADLDLEWTGAVARNAGIIYVYSTNATLLSAPYAIDNNLAPIISLSFGLEACEASFPQSASNALRALAQQAAVQGITWLASSGDTGAAGCDSKDSTQATHGLDVQLPAAIPEVTAVGGTEFAEGNGTYWSNTNSASGASALSYVPETAWNDSIVGIGLSASGGGASTLFSKPSWQAGPGVPNDGSRDVPDLALGASPYHDGYRIYSGGQLQIVGGTSASTPSFAGIVALANQYLVANGVQSKSGLGNINPALYRLAQSTTAVFHDITTGNNIVPCEVFTPDCGLSGSFGYTAGPGYDLVTGWGSVDAYNLVIAWRTLVATAVTKAPVIPSGGAVSAASYTQPALLAPGMIFSLFGNALTDGTTAAANAAPLPRQLANAGLLVNGIAAPLFFASPTQINAQFPIELAGITSATIQVVIQTEGTTVVSNAITVPVGPFAPGLFTWNQNGSGPGAILRNSDFTKICPAGRSDCAENLAVPGEAVAIYMTGLGQVNGQVASGDPAPALATTLTTPTVTIGGINAPVLFSGLAEGFVGLYQVNVFVPLNAPLGDSVSVIVNIGGISSNVATIAIAGGNTATLRLINNLIYPVNFVADGTQIAQVAASSETTITMSVGATLQVQFTMIQPTVNGQPIGDSVSGSFTAISNPSGTISFTASPDFSNGVSYFAPLINNETSSPLLLGVNVGLQAQNLCNCDAPANTIVNFGYYRYFSNSDVRAYLPNSGYSGPYIYFGWDPLNPNGTITGVNSTTGVVQLNVAQVP